MTQRPDYQPTWREVLCVGCGALAVRFGVKCGDTDGEPLKQGHWVLHGDGVHLVRAALPIRTLSWLGSRRVEIIKFLVLGSWAGS